MKREIPLFVCVVSALAMIIAYYSPKLDWMDDMLQKWFLIIAVFAFILGAISIILVNGNRISKQVPGWGYNVVLLIGLFVTLGLGIFGGIDPKTPFFYIFTYIFTPLSATMFSLLAFFIASAAFRAFKAKTWEATLLLIAAFIVMLGRVPLGELMWSWLPVLKHYSLNNLVENWIMGCFNTAGQRAILLGASVGLISISLKILLGIERPYMGGE
ncbi:MAG: hypothetical protein M1269_12615 [Chloroflexi bacterium]|nr:hypothetical protein [Chloroflexota bacterium]